MTQLGTRLPAPDRVEATPVRPRGQTGDPCCPDRPIPSGGQAIRYRTGEQAFPSVARRPRLPVGPVNTAELGLTELVVAIQVTVTEPPGLPRPFFYGYTD